ncbi:MAG: UDP-N-acetylglucosamine 1-carboxyvinyltransferase, partial [Clostridia bacterium]|nr:UDP-N-acetylglucosamine 1-carboxyvinyltransferase [Clostridia bacterium]
MEKFIITGGKRLSGEVRISGNKNASLAVLAGVCLCDEPCRIENLAQITDIDVMMQIYSYLGANVRYLNKNTLEIDPSGIANLEIPYSLTKLIRSSYYFMG